MRLLLQNCLFIFLIILINDFTKHSVLGANPCGVYSLNDCDPLAECNNENPYDVQCQCPKGYIDVSANKKKAPGRKCIKDEDKCLLGTFKECDINADCIKTIGGHTCRCKNGYIDISTNQVVAPGRSCKKNDLCKTSDCAPEAECRTTETGIACQCTSGYVDISAQHGKPNGRVCRILENECENHKHDCSENSKCIDTPESFTCRCLDNYRDDSQNTADRPGRVCTKTFVPEAPECEVNDPLSCSKENREVCLFKDSTYKCTCPKGYSRLPNGRCLVINECEFKNLNTCSKDAECIDQTEGYTCQCKSGFADVSIEGQTGRICRPIVDECKNPKKYGVDCDVNSICKDTDSSYTCRCFPGYADVSEKYNLLPGRKCVLAVNECLDIKLNDCSSNAICKDEKEGYSCECKLGFVDVSANSALYPGRVCNKPEKENISPNVESSLDQCDPTKPNSCGLNEVCTNKIKEDFVCDCAENAIRYYDGQCRRVAVCQSFTDCDPNAECVNIFDSYICQCRSGFFDISPDPETQPGKVCEQLKNECADPETHTCSPFAHCIDATHGYACVCLNGYTDTSSQHGLLPGRKCSNSQNECLDKSLNSCDENADCIDTPDNYACKCFSGYIDLSSSAHLPPGRVCTVQTTCPKQKTDLMFLIDGSGSIGSTVFSNEILRFIGEFLELFDIGLDNTRVGLIQFSDQIRYEFNLNQYNNKSILLDALSKTKYLTGLTLTGSAIHHMVREGFSESRGARPISPDVSRVAIVITDGRSQDNVTEPALAARNSNISTFSIGVTDHVLASELELIAGSSNRWFYVNQFKELDLRLRSLIQKLACPTREKIEKTLGSCNPDKQTGCDRTRNEICIVGADGQTKCKCPEKFQRHPLTHVCGGDLCNSDVITSCEYPDTCEPTPFGNHRCICPNSYTRDAQTGVCVSQILPLTNCSAGYERNSQTGKCVIKGSCDPQEPVSCDLRKRESCLIHSSNLYYTCQCSSNERHPVTGVCLVDECSTGKNDCDLSAKCQDTAEGYICICPTNSIDNSRDKINKPGRICSLFQNECETGQNRCSKDAICIDTSEKYICQCKPGFIDISPNPRNESGIVCKQKIDECARPELNTCHENAICIDTEESYKCVCKNDFVDLDKLRNPGRHCQKNNLNDRCEIGKNDCGENALCQQLTNNQFTCFCLPGFRDVSPDRTKPGRKCAPIVHLCEDISLNDCDNPTRAICKEVGDEEYVCKCRDGFYDDSPNPDVKPGRSCKPLKNECADDTHDCARIGGVCKDTIKSYTCECAKNFKDISPNKNYPGRECQRLINECATGQHDCSGFAICTDTEESYTCACPANYVDLSESKQKPGRICSLKIDECAKGLHDCSKNAECKDLENGYLCVCNLNFIDESPDIENRPGRVCRPNLVDECRTNQHDCHSNAICQDLTYGYTCQCAPEYLDESPHRITKPGRICVPRPTPPPEECRLDTSSCKEELNEVCRIINSVPKCACPINYSRNEKTHACTTINECQFPQLNNCDPSAECIDQLDGYTCQCRKGFRDVSADVKKPGRNCIQATDKCKYPHLNDCHLNAKCTNTDDGYTCECILGYKDMNPDEPGRLCQKLLNECARKDLNTCDKNAVCTDLEIGYKCECPPNYLDISPSLPGRACKLIVDECANKRLNDCDQNAKCIDTIDSYKCECPENSRDISPNLSYPGRACRIFENECLNERNDCDSNAICRDNEESFTCECKQGFMDQSPNKLQKPGRYCVELIDECKTNRHTCSAQAICRDLEVGYTCECKDGYVDQSPDLAARPGRICGVSGSCPQNHECSSAATCEPLGGNQYKCTCISGYMDQSLDSNKRGRICVRHNPCQDLRLNKCSRNAVCYNEPNGYRCECLHGFIDKSVVPTERGRICEPPVLQQSHPRHPCQEPELNDCHPLGACRALGPDSYTCECLSGYFDRSPDISKKPGRLCQAAEPLCLDSTKNDCHSEAICTEIKTNKDDFVCQCRDGYADESPDRTNRPGRICVEEINECLDRNLNDCDPIATCEDHSIGYTCRCPINSIDQSIDKRRPGRKCFVEVNECNHHSLNNCSRFADCIDKIGGYECRCHNGYHDDNKLNPGTKCSYIINECESQNLNDCHVNADCIDTLSGYDCRCRVPFADVGPENRKGRKCVYDECSNKKMNTCHQDAICKDTDDGYTCTCKEGFYDQSKNNLEPGRQCIAFNEDEIVTSVPLNADNKKNVIACGLSECKLDLNEVCVGGIRCTCRPGEGRSKASNKCQPIDKTPLVVRVISRNNEPLFYSSVFGNNKNDAFVEFADEFQNDIGRAIGGTNYAPLYVNTDVSYITHPKTVNSSWPDGLLVNFTVGTSKSKTSINRCDLWNQLMESFQRSNNAIGGGRISVASDVDLLDPCAKPLPKGDLCGGSICNAELNEICIGDTVCGCVNGEKRASQKDKCRPVEGWQFPLWVIRKNLINLIFNETFSNPQNELYDSYVKSFENGIKQCYPNTNLKDQFVTAEVSEIIDPMAVNASWNTGLLFNTTAYFRKGSVKIPSSAYYSLIRYIIDKNNYQVGNSGLYLNPYQPDPFKACYKNDCHPKGICIDLGPSTYRCECSAGYLDKNPSDPGRHCRPTTNYNECEKKEDNECSENARCIDLEYLYKCECNKGFSDASPKGSIPGSNCVLDYCSDVNYCSINSTCVNTKDNAECQCKNGFVDIRKSKLRVLTDLHPDAYCLNTRDIDECALGLHNCSSVAICTDLKIGYTCACPTGYVDGNPSLPGRTCAALLCDLCNQHGDCIPDSLTNNITCACTEGFSGEFCEVAPSSLPFILFIILALLFLLLALCCLLYMCTKCHCFKRRAQAFPWNTLDQSNSSDSGADFSGSEMYIPRAKLKPTENMADANAQQLAQYLDDHLRIPRARLADADSLGSGSSEFTIREEIERRIITDVTTTELRTTEDANNEVNQTVTSTVVHSSNDGTGVKTNTNTSSHFGGGSSSDYHNVSYRSGAYDEQERAESVAEFSNSRGEYRRGGENSVYSSPNHTHNFSEDHQDDRSLGDYASDNEGGVYDKSILVNHHHNYDPENGVERYKKEVTTKKNLSETYHK